MGGLLEDWAEQDRLKGNRPDLDALRAIGDRHRFAVKDSGKRAQFESGMVRDTQEGKTDFWRLYIGPMLKRWADLVTNAATKYPDVRPGVPNWTLAEGEEELARFRASAARHFHQWMMGETDEDHAAAVIFNINGAEFVKEKMRDAA